MTKKRWLGVLVVLIAVAGVWGASNVYANVTSDGVIHGCVVTTSRVLKVPIGTNCAKGSTPLSWPATTTPLSVRIIQQSASVPAGLQEGTAVLCPQGTTVLGGGYDLQTDDILANVNASQPFLVTNGTAPPGTTGWTVTVSNESGSTMQYTVYATCATGIPAS